MFLAFVKHETRTKLETILLSKGNDKTCSEYANRDFLMPTRAQLRTRSTHIEHRAPYFASKYASPSLNSFLCSEVAVQKGLYSFEQLSNNSSLVILKRASSFSGSSWISNRDNRNSRSSRQNVKHKILGHKVRK